MLYLNRPKDFHSKFDVVGCFVKYDGKILLLRRQDHKTQGDQFGMVAGKVDEGETLEQAILRELKEEAGLIVSPDKLQYKYKTYIKFPGYDFLYHIFKITLEKSFDVKINPTEHKEFTWMTPLEALHFPNAMEDLDECIKLIYFSTDK